MRWTFNGQNPWIILRHWRKGDTYWLNIWWHCFNQQTYRAYHTCRGCIYISNKVILWLAWGRREEYPTYVIAHWKLWVKWLLTRNIKQQDFAHSEPRRKKNMTDIKTTVKAPAYDEKTINALMAQAHLDADKNDGVNIQTDTDYDGVIPADVEDTVH